jgi:hypothetical protein
MFEDQRFLGIQEGSEKLIVQTRAGNNLENFIAPAPGYPQVGRYERLRQKNPGWENRKPATGIYNCAGLVWASRRTSLPNPDDWRRILRDDGYRETTGIDLSVGDVAVYVKADSTGISRRHDREILHVARICFFREGGMAGKIPWALSKWDSQCGEDIHPVRGCPALCGGEMFELEFWTDRPERQKPRLIT